MKNRKSIELILIATMALIIITAAGCQKKQPDTINPAATPVDQNTNQSGDKSTDKGKKKSIVETSKPKTYLEQVEDIIKNKKNVTEKTLTEAIAFYKELMTKLPKGDKAREELLDYIMAESLKMVQSKDRQKIQIGLDVALALNNIEAGNFYVQNRIIYAYTGFAKLERTAGNLDKAQAYTEKALAYRFDGETMRLRLEILMEKTKQDIAAKKYADARTLLKEIVNITGIPENIGMYKKENADAEALLNKIQGK